MHIDIAAAPPRCATGRLSRYEHRRGAPPGAIGLQTGIAVRVDLSPAGDDPFLEFADRDEAATAIRGLIERIVLSPGEKSGEVHATLHGDLGTILEWTADGDGKNQGGTSPPGVTVSTEPGTRFGAYLP